MLSQTFITHNTNDISDIALIIRDTVPVHIDISLICKYDALNVFLYAIPLMRLTSNSINIMLCKYTPIKIIDLLYNNTVCMRNVILHIQPNTKQKRTLIKKIIHHHGITVGDILAHKIQCNNWTLKQIIHNLNTSKIYAYTYIRKTIDKTIQYIKLCDTYDDYKLFRENIMDIIDLMIHISHIDINIYIALEEIHDIILMIYWKNAIHYM